MEPKPSVIKERHYIFSQSLLGIVIKEWHYIFSQSLLGIFKPSVIKERHYIFSQSLLGIFKPTVIKERHYIFSQSLLGIFKHSQTVGKSYLSDISSGVEQSTILGHFNAVSSIGFILGPTVGGHLAEKPGGFYTVAILAGLLFFINFGEQEILFTTFIT